MKKDMFDELFDELVPSMGKADTVAGELIRATARLQYRFFNDGDKVLSGYGNETCNGSLRYITSELKDLTRSEDLNVVGSEDLKDEFNKLWDGDSMLDDEYEEQLEVCVEMMVKFVDENKDLKSITNEDDSTSDFDEPEDYDYYDDYEYDYEYDDEYDEDYDDYEET